MTRLFISTGGAASYRSESLDSLCRAGGLRRFETAPIVMVGEYAGLRGWSDRGRDLGGARRGARGERRDGGVFAANPVTMTLAKRQGRWMITAYEEREAS